MDWTGYWAFPRSLRGRGLGCVREDGGQFACRPYPPHHHSCATVALCSFAHAEATLQLASVTRWPRRQPLQKVSENTRHSGLLPNRDQQVMSMLCEVPVAV